MVAESILEKAPVMEAVLRSTFQQKPWVMQLSKHILVVEDDLNLGFLLVELLEEAGYRVKLCKDGKMAWQSLPRHH